MGNQDLQGVKEQLHSDQVLHCLRCKEEFNLVNKAPIMVCLNQHNYCEMCLEEVNKAKRCLQCKESLLPKRKRNAVVCYILQKLNPNESNREVKVTVDTYRDVPKTKRSQSPDAAMFNTFESPEKKAIKLKSVKQQSIPNLNLQLYKEQKQFRKKYSVASIFSSKDISESTVKPKNQQETFEEKLAKYAEDYHIIPFKNILQEKKDPSTIVNIDLHLYKIPKIFDLFSRFTSLMRLNLNKNRISKIQNLEQLKQLNYLSLSDNQIDRIQNLEELTQLKNLYLNKNKIEKIENVGALTSIEFLGLAFNLIQQINNISHMGEMKWLNLQGNFLTKIEGIMTLKKLEIVLLGSNEITIFEGFDELPALQQIHIENNKITNLSKALSMKHLRKIKLEDNPGLHEDNSQEYLKLLEIIQAKSKGIEKPQDGCLIY